MSVPASRFPSLIGAAAPAGVMLDIVEYLKQFTTWNFKAPLTADDYRWASYQMRATLNSTTTTAQVTQRVPANWNALLYAIQGHLAFDAITAETLSITGVGNPGIQDRILMKAMNTRIDLQVSDRQEKLFETAVKPLSNLLTVVGGEPFTMNPPHFIKGGDTIQLDLSLGETTAAVIGGAYRAGVDLKILLVRNRE